jgi:hypothetical protein
MNYVEVRMTRLLLFALQDIQAALPFKGDDIDLRNWFSERNAQALLNAINECSERRYGFAYPPGTYIVRGGLLIDTLTESLSLEEKRLREEERARAEKAPSTDTGGNGEESNA